MVVYKSRLHRHSEKSFVNQQKCRELSLADGNEQLLQLRKLLAELGPDAAAMWEKRIGIFDKVNCCHFNGTIAIQPDS